MMTYPEFLFRKGDEVVCPSCKEVGFIPEDISFSEASNLIRCMKCGALSRLENCQLVNSNTEVEE